MSGSQHVCCLPPKDTTGMPKLAPNAPLYKKLIRNFWKLFLLNSTHFKSKLLFRNQASIILEKKRHARSPYFYVIHPLSIINSILEVFIFFLWMYAFIYESLDLIRYYTISTTIQEEFMSTHHYVVIPARCIVVIILFNVGYIDGKTKEIIIIPKKIIKRYLTTYFFFDALTTYLPFFLVQYLIQIDVIGGSDSSDYRWEHILEVACLLGCLARMHILLDFMDNALSNIKCNKLVKFMTIRLIKTFFYLHIFSWMMFFIPQMVYAEDNYPEGSWLFQAGIVDNDNVFRVYFESFTITICYFFGIAERYQLDETNEQICAGIITFFGRLYTLFLLADFLNALGIAGVSESKYERQLALLHKYMAAKELPQGLRQRMIKYFEYKFQGRYFQESDTLNALSDSLRTELFLFSANKLVQKNHIFKKIPRTSLAVLISMMKSEIYSPKDVIIKLGSKSTDVYFISSGTVAIINANGLELCHEEDGDMLGSSSFILKYYMYAAVAVEATEVFSINKDLLIEMLQPHAGLMVEVYQAAKEKMFRLKNLEDRAATGKFDVMSELQKGNILEKRVRRPRIDVE